MPTKPQSRCTEPTCRKLHDGTGRCSACRARSDTRPPASRRGYDKAHEAFAAAVIDRDIVCQCNLSRQHGHGEFCPRLAERADHYPLGRDQLVAIGADPNDPNHGRGLCPSCDSSQTAQRQPGGFNRRN